MESSSYSLASASGEILVIIDKKVKTDISIDNKVEIQNCDLFILPTNFESNMILGNDIFICLRNLGIDIFEYASEHTNSLVDNQIYAYEDALVHPYSGYVLDCYMVSKINAENVILKPFELLPGVKLEIPECVASPNNLKIIILNNTSFHIEIKRGLAVGTFEPTGPVIRNQ